MKVGLVGTGAFGSLMAKHMSARFDTHVWNRTPENISAELRESCTVHADLSTLADQVDCVVVSLHGESAIRDVFLGTHRLATLLKPGTIVVDTSTTSPWHATEMSAALSAHGLISYDCPVAGGLEGAIEGSLVIFGGGPERDWAQVAEVLSAFARSSHLLGPAGAGQTAKALNVLLLGTAIIGVAEAIAVARRAGLDPQQLVAALSQGTAQSWALDRRAMNMITGDHARKGTCELIARDLRISYELATRSGVQADFTKHAMEIYDRTLAQGLSEQDISAVIELYP